MYICICIYMLYLMCMSASCVWVSFVGLFSFICRSLFIHVGLFSMTISSTVRRTTSLSDLQGPMSYMLHRVCMTHRPLSFTYYKSF